MLQGCDGQRHCLTCHDEKRGPFLWEHAPVRGIAPSAHTPARLYSTEPGETARAVSVPGLSMTNPCTQQPSAAPAFTGGSGPSRTMVLRRASTASGVMAPTIPPAPDWRGSDDETTTSLYELKDSLPLVARDATHRSQGGVVTATRKLCSFAGDHPTPPLRGDPPSREERKVIVPLCWRAYPHPAAGRRVGAG